jgi:peptidoglycan/xylan/chitin deacetylase (PgdA/CDA1 family)
MTAMVPAGARRRLRPAAARLRLWRRRLSAQRAGLAIVYHASEAPAGDPATELVASHGPNRLAAQLRHVARHYRPVPASELAEAARRRRRGQRFPVAVTFDDDLACHLEVASPALNRAGIVGTFFLTGASLDGNRPEWWRSLQLAHDRGLLDESLREEIAPGVESGIHSLAARVEALPEPQLERVVERLDDLVGDAAADPGLPASAVTAILAAGHQIGFHTRRHVRLPGLSRERLQEALREGREELESICGKALKVIAYPHGKADAEVAEAARKAGFSAGFTGRPVAVSAEDDPLLIGRLQPTYRGGGAFEMQLATALADAARRQ